MCGKKRSAHTINVYIALRLFILYAGFVTAPTIRGKILRQIQPKSYVRIRRKIQSKINAV
jgi:hypothetical protein